MALKACEAPSVNRNHKRGDESIMSRKINATVKSIMISNQAINLTILGMMLVTNSLADEDDDRFKAFLATPPPIDSMMFITKSKEIQNGSRSYATNASLYLMRWQTNAFFMCEGKSVKHFYAPQLPSVNFASAYDRYRWMANDYISKKASLSDGATNDVVRESAHFNNLAMAVLNIGIRIATPGSVAWTNTHGFAGITHAGKRFEGEILSLDEHRVISLRYSIPDHPELWAYAEYEYNNANLPSFMPSHIRHYYINNNKHTTNSFDDYEILSFKLGEKPLPMEAFDPMNLLTTNNIMGKLMDVHYTNNRPYLLADGRIEYITKKRWFKGNSVELFWGSILFTNVTILVIYYYVKNKRRRSS
jgi:hypothetical protein